MAENENKKEKVEAENKKLEENKVEVKKEEVKTEKKFEQVKPETEKKQEKEKEKSEEKKPTKPKKETPKKETKVKAQNKKSKGILVRATAVIIILFVIIALIYLAMPSPEKSINGMLKALKEGNFEEVTQYVNYEEIANIPALEVTQKDKEKALYEQLTWKINKIKQEGETATVEVEVTNKNYNTVFTNFIQKIVKKAFAGEEVTGDITEELENVDVMTTIQTIQLTKQEGKWKVQVDDNLRNALYPGLQEAIQTIQAK